MANPAKRKGTAWETAITNALKARRRFSHAARVAQTGRWDQGDIHAWPFVIQAKAVRKFDLAGWVKDVAEQRAHAGFPHGVVFVKKYGRPLDEGYAVMSIGSYMELMDAVADTYLPTNKPGGA